MELKNVSYLMVKPGWNRDVYSVKQIENDIYCSKVYHIVFDILSLQSLVPLIGIITTINSEQLKIMYPQYVNELTFEYLCDFYARNSSLLLLIYDRLEGQNCTERILSLKKDYQVAASSLDYRQSLRELRKIPSRGTLTPNLTNLAMKVKNGQPVITQDGRDLTPRLISTLYGTGAVVHSPSTHEEALRDIEAMLGDRQQKLMAKLQTLKDSFPYASGMLYLYYHNAKNGNWLTLSSNDYHSPYWSKKIANSTMIHRVARPWRQLEKLGIIPQTQLPEIPNVIAEYCSWSKYA